MSDLVAMMKLMMDQRSKLERQLEIERIETDLLFYEQRADHWGYYEQLALEREKTNQLFKAWSDTCHSIEKLLQE